MSGASREQAIERSRRALDEFRVSGIATALPFHRAVVRDPALRDMTVHTRWIETEWDASVVQPQETGDGPEEAGPRERIVVEVAGKRLEVVLPAGRTGAAPANGPGAGPRRSARRKHGAQVSGNALTAPMQGTIVKVAVAEGDTVAVGDLVVVLEAMKMEQPLTAHRAGTITGLTATAGEVVQSDSVICEIA